MSRTRKSSTLKLRQGTFRPDRDQATLELRAGVPPCPSELDSVAVEVWHSITDELAPSAVLTKADGPTLAVFAQSVSDWRAATLAIQQSGRVVLSPDGRPITSPWVAIANQAAKQILAFANVLGLSPAARTRIGIAAPEPQSELDEFKLGAS